MTHEIDESCVTTEEDGRCMVHGSGSCPANTVLIMRLRTENKTLHARLALYEKVVEAAEKVNEYLLNNEELMKYSAPSFKEFRMKSDIYALRAALLRLREKEGRL